MINQTHARTHAHFLRTLLQGATYCLLFKFEICCVFLRLSQLNVFARAIFGLEDWFTFPSNRTFDWFNARTMQTKKKVRIPGYAVHESSIEVLWRDRVYQTAINREPKHCTNTRLTYTHVPPRSRHRYFGSERVFPLCSDCRSNGSAEPNRLNASAQLIRFSRNVSAVAAAAAAGI